MHGFAGAALILLSSVILETAAQADGTSTIVWQDDQTGRVWVEEHSRLFCGDPDVPAKSWTPGHQEDYQEGT